MTPIIQDWGCWWLSMTETSTVERLVIILKLIRNRSNLDWNRFTANSKISTDNPEDRLGSNSRDGPHMIFDTWLYFKNLSFIVLKGQINVGDRRIRHTTTQNSNDAIFNRFWVFNRLFLTLISKIKWLGSGLPLKFSDYQVGKDK